MMRSYTMIDGMPSGMVTMRCTVFPPVSMDKMSELEAFAGMTNSPALIVLDAPNTFARFTKALADLTTPVFSSCWAAEVMLDPGLITTLVSRSSGPAAVQP